MTPVERLRTFIAEMLAWESAYVKQCWACDRNLRDADREKVAPSFRKKLVKAYEVLKEEATEKCRAILKEHLSARAFAVAEKDYLRAMTTCKDTFAQEVLPETEKREGETIFIEAVRNRHGGKEKKGGETTYYKYALVMENGEPKVDIVRRYWDDKDKWEKYRDFYPI